MGALNLNTNFFNATYNTILQLFLEHVTLVQPRGNGRDIPYRATAEAITKSGFTAAQRSESGQT
jgi:hypothetical protein